ncbi:RES family NAD+ phosphorylase [Pikeienuella piscinae]|nr:RES family NAD+ phosphorylase [Pikeienuella piscinae]
MKLVDNAEEQERLEALLDETKPPVPAPCRHLHWLMFTPFRYPARTESRFRRAGPLHPVFYAAESVDTAIAEIAFWRLLFFIESPAAPWPANPVELTAFSTVYETAKRIDLTAPPFDAAAALWTHPTDYTACHDLVDQAFALGAEAIRSTSARDPLNRANVTLLSCAAFRDAAPRATRTWRLSLSAAGPFARCETPARALSFGRDAFAADPRIAAMNWER